MKILNLSCKRYDHIPFSFSCAVMLHENQMKQCIIMEAVVEKRESINYGKVKLNLIVYLALGHKMVLQGMELKDKLLYMFALSILNVMSK